MLRAAFLALGVVALLGFLLAGRLQTNAETAYPKVQWVTDGQPDGPVERARIDGLARLKGSGPEGSAFIERRYRSRSQPFGIEQRVYAFARLGCTAALLTAIAGVFLHRKLQRSDRIARGEAP